MKRESKDSVCRRKSLFAMECRACSICKPLTAYDTHTIVGRYKTCKSCRAGTEAKRLSTIKGFAVRLADSARTHAREMTKQGRINAGYCHVLAQDVVDMWEEQVGLCCYSGLPMALGMHLQWQASLERLDSTKGYSRDNCALCVLELNHFRPWTKQKLMMLKDASVLKPVRLSKEDFEAPTRSRGDGQRGESRMVDGTLQKKCKACCTYQEADKFQGLSFRCRPCKNEKERRDEQSPYRHITGLIRHARCKNKKRNARGRLLGFDIDSGFLIDLYLKQKGRCAYSEMPMTVGARDGKDWVMSLERMDVHVGYLKTNVCLICFEFNTGNRQWTKDKLQVLKTRLASQM